jgi:hypothetical protein
MTVWHLTISRRSSWGPVPTMCKRWMRAPVATIAAALYLTCLAPGAMPSSTGYMPFATLFIRQLTSVPDRSDCAAHPRRDSRELKE